jgi:succinoglycan biosynthesis protein ExoM
MISTLTIAVPTFRRPDWLGQLLDSLAACETPPEIDPAVTLCVIDNDPERSARTVVRERAARLSPWRLVYLHEAEPGVVAVRNRALDVSRDSDLLAFVDDDLLVSPGWLRALVRARMAFGADVVFGPVAPIYEPETPEWIRRLQPHGRPIERDGPRQEVGPTCNCLIDRGAVARLGLRFDPRMSAIGAEDTLFFTEMKERGAVLANAAGAACREHIAPSRASLRWLLLRWSRAGATDHMISTRRSGRRRSRLAGLLKGALRVGGGAVMLAASSLAMAAKGRGAAASPLRTLARGCGMIAYAFGLIFAEYARPR